MLLAPNFRIAMWLFGMQASFHLALSRSASDSAMRADTGEKGRRTIMKSKKAEPQVGIIFAVGDFLLIEGTPVSEASSYGDFKIHDKSHIRYWGEMGIDGEYEEYPRGRVGFNAKAEEFVFLLDPCIIARPKLVSEIKRCMNLPKSVKPETDSHYFCRKCMG